MPCITLVGQWAIKLASSYCTCSESTKGVNCLTPYCTYKCKTKINSKGSPHVISAQLTPVCNTINSNYAGWGLWETLGPRKDMLSINGFPTSGQGLIIFFFFLFIDFPNLPQGPESKVASSIFKVIKTDLLLCLQLQDIVMAEINVICAGLLPDSRWCRSAMVKPLRITWSYKALV